MPQLNLTCFQNFPTLKTNRLTLRSIQPEDAQRIFQMRSNSRTNEFILRPNMENAANADELVTRVQEGYNNQQVLAWAGLLRDQQEIIGTCGFNSINHQNMRAEIGGELFVDYWGKHLAIEAVTEIIRYGFEGMNLHTIEAKVNPGNRGALFLLEQLGFEREAYFKDYGYYNGEFHDLAVYTKFNAHHSI